jgi:hypothetical protein
MDQSNMKEALKRNRAKGIDLTIIVNGEDMSPGAPGNMPEGSEMEEMGESPDEEETEALGLAPEATPMAGAEGPMPLKGMQMSPDDDADPTELIANSLRGSPMGATPLGNRAMDSADKKFPPKKKKI